MINKKEVVRHFILNLLTVLKFEIEDNKNVYSTTKMLDLIAMASRIVAYESFFLEKKPELFIQDNVSVNDVIIIVCSVLNEKIKKKKIKVTGLKSNIVASIDKNFFIDAIKFLLNDLTDNTSLLKFSFDNDKNTLLITHDSNSEYTFLEEPISNCLKSTNISNNLVSLRLAVAILLSLNINIIFDKNIVRIDLSKTM